MNSRNLSIQSLDLRLSAGAPRHRSNGKNSAPSALGFALFLATAMGVGGLMLCSAASHKLGMDPSIDTTHWLASFSTWLSNLGGVMSAGIAMAMSAGKLIGLGVLLLALALTLRGLDWALRATLDGFNQRSGRLALPNGSMPLLRISHKDGILMLRPSLS